MYKILRKQQQDSNTRNAMEPKMLDGTTMMIIISVILTAVIQFLIIHVEH